MLRSDWLTTGPNVEEFEEAVADYVGAKYAVAVSSGTAALYLACLATGIGNGDEGITSPITFLTSANAIAYCGATPRFADIDPHTYNISVSELEKRITPKTRVVIPVKHITTGEGGMVVTHNRDLAQKIRKLRSHGITREPEDFICM